MNAADLLAKLPSRDHALGLLYYVAAVAGLLVVTAVALATLGERYASYSESAALLEKMESRRPPGARAGADAGAELTGSPFLEATSLTIAGAELQKHVTALIRDGGGNVLSSQVDLQQPEGSTDRVGLTVSAEIDQPAVQKLVYDIEAGMPFLFIDRLQLQPVQQQGGGTAGSKLRIQMTISGQWQETKP